MSATIWKGRLAFGLVSIPVRLHKAARRERVQFHNVYPLAVGQSASAPSQAEDAAEPPSKVRQFPGQRQGPEQAPLPERVARVHRAFVGEDSNTVLAHEQIFKGYELEPDRYVVLRSSEVAALRARASTNLEIAQFVALDEIDRNYFDVSYYVAPDHGGEKAYALFYRALVDTGCVAVGELVMYGREYAVCIRPGSHGLVLHTLFFANEVRVEEESPADLGLVDDKELDLAKMLVNAQKAPFDPKRLKDKFQERVLELVENRTRAAVAGRAPSPQRSAAPVVDIMDALRKSLDAVRKPPQSEVGERSPRKKDKRRAK